MSLDIAAIHDELAAQVAANLQRDLTGYGFDPGPGARSYPCVIVRPRDPWVEFHRTFGDTCYHGIEVDVVVMVSAAQGDALRALADYASNDAESGSSMRAAIESDRTLGGLVEDLCCLRCETPVEGAGVTGWWELAFPVELHERRSTS